MRVTVRANAISPPLLDTAAATSIELRDPKGRLIYVVVMLPGASPNGTCSFVTSDINDPDFTQFVKGFGFVP